MDYPFIRPHLYNVSNNIRLLPIDLYQINQKQSKPTEQIQSPTTTFDFINEISDSKKFNYMIIILVVILFIYRLNLHLNVWIGLFVGLLIIYHLNNKNTIGNSNNQIKKILQSDILKNTQYFTSNVQLIDWITRSRQFKKLNVLVFNSMVKSLDNFLRLTQEIKSGLRDSKQSFNILQDLRTVILNQFQSLIQTMPSVPYLRQEFNFLLKKLSTILNDHILEIQDEIDQHYENQPINVNSQMVTHRLEDPKPNDLTYNPNYNFYN